MSEQSEVLEALKALVSADSAGYPTELIRYEGLFDRARLALHKATDDASWLTDLDYPGGYSPAKWPVKRKTITLIPHYT